MSQDYFGVIEMVFSFGVILGIAVWQLVSLDRAKTKTQAKLAARNAAEAPSDKP